MLRTKLQVAALLLTAVSAVALSAPECLVGERYVPSGTQITVYDEVVWVTIDGSQPSYVAHGFGSDASCGGLFTDPGAVCAFGQEHMRFSLTLDGDPIDPAGFNSLGRSEPVSSSECPPDPNRVTWSALWVFEFPAYYFAAGNHELVGTWWLKDYPFACFPCPDDARAEQEAEGVWEITGTTFGAVRQQSITLTVLYPP